MKRLAIGLALAIPAFSGDWNPRLAADYMDARQKEWFAWPRANTSGAPCMSCHTGMTYMLVRPELRRVLGETQSTEYEQGYSRTLRARVEKTAPANPAALDGFGTDSVLAALLLVNEDGPKLSAEGRKALDRMWATQMPDGGWPWYSLNDDPWEMPESRFFGAALAAVAAGTAPAEYRRPEAIARLARFLSHDESQPFQNRLLLLWASAKLPEVLQPARRNAIVQQARRSQQADGSWTIASLGPWHTDMHPQAPESKGNSAYATAFAAFMLEQAGLTNSDPMLKRALDWLRSHQDPKGGYWDAVSMNKEYEAGSMMELFMRDAATGFASMALLNAGHAHVDRSTRP